jgi:RimJ/RimL family protein N-acetyltransferase
VPETARLILRPPRLQDADAFAAINADPQVTEFVSLTGPLARGESDLMLRKMLDHWADHHFGWWMADLRETGELIGFVGLSHPLTLPAMAAEVEVGWRLAREHWGQGYATEGGAEAIRWAFGERGLGRLISIIDRDNHRSLRVAAKLGFRHWRDMDHPRWPRGVQIHRLEPVVTSAPGGPQTSSWCRRDAGTG